ncbi:hypothetical protein B0T19DRAFT_491238 [Cercophora scortea]|uniref:Tyrosinase copper-binding domain-containing protein n=1 Tax=Cercophora scortea TaxID=314031 RepID=A0AAE0IZ57_9PEZI|nr:hypothetical protein B0T19DRAFT_491238 [Cercophora scortea]
MAAVYTIAVAAALSWFAAATPVSSSSSFSSVTSSSSSSQSTPIPVVGVRTGIDPRTGQRPARQNINQLYARGGPQWDLYILALSSLQAVNETDELSYFQIAGIHGLPHRAWNGVEQVPGAPSGAGYCPHGELLFATWHRPYVALFEQTLVSHAVAIASQYPANIAPTYLSAAQTLRQPYWDWAAEPLLPPATTTPNITITSPRGSITIPNPLYSYRFQPGSLQSTFPGSLSQYNQTIRCLSSSPGTPGQDNNLNNATASDASMASVSSDLLAQVYDVFTRTVTFEAMAYDNSSSPASSFENPHNIVHDKAGCGAGSTLGNIDWSAFDPLFMLHHCNVDRLVAMWQAIHFQAHTIFNTTGISTGQFGTPAGTVTSSSSPLKPFFRSTAGDGDGEDGVLSTSDDVARISALGYTYPELADDWTKTPDELAASVRASVNALYMPGGACCRRDRRYYTARVEVDRAQLDLPATVRLLVRGQVVGRMVLLAMPTVGLASASLPLVQPPGVGNASRDLAGLMTVGIIRSSDGAIISADAVPSLKVEIHGFDYTPPSSRSDFPGFGNATRWPVRIPRGGG